MGSSARDNLVAIRLDGPWSISIDSVSVSSLPLPLDGMVNSVEKKGFGLNVTVWTTHSNQTPLSLLLFFVEQVKTSSDGLVRGVATNFVTA